MPAKMREVGIFLGFKRIINVIKLVLLNFLIAYISLHILNRTVLVLLGSLGGYIIRFPQKQLEFYSNVPAKMREVRYFFDFKRTINVIKLVLLIFLIAYIVYIVYIY